MDHGDAAFLMEVFSLIDKRGEGTIPAKDVGYFLRAAGTNPNEAELKKVVEELGGPEKSITYEEAYTQYQSLSQKLPKADKQKFMEIFKFCDKSGQGLIPLAEMTQILTTLGDKMKDDEVTTILAGHVNHEGFVNYEHATIYVGNLDDKVNESILWELFLQAGPIALVHMPKDRVSGTHQGYGFVEFLSEEDAEYALKVMNMIKLYGKPVRINKAAAQPKNLDVGANIFVGNLDPEIDEKMLYDIFSAFGVILQTPKVMRDMESGSSKGFAFVNYASFEASDAAIAAMNGQHLLNRAISVSYAFKKDAKGERHGSSAERLLATTNPLTVTDKPHQLFADAPPVILNPDAPGGAVPMQLPPQTTMPSYSHSYFQQQQQQPQQQMNPFAPNAMSHLPMQMMPNQHPLPPFGAIPPGILRPPPGTMPTFQPPPPPQQ